MSPRSRGKQRHPGLHNLRQHIAIASGRGERSIASISFWTATPFAPAVVVFKILVHLLFTHFFVNHLFRNTIASDHVQLVSKCASRHVSGRALFLFFSNFSIFNSFFFFYMYYTTFALGGFQQQFIFLFKW